MSKQNLDKLTLGELLNMQAECSSFVEDKEFNLTLLKEIENRKKKR